MPKILIIDDDPGIAHSLGLYLKASAFEVVSCLRGGDALAVFQAEDPDLAIVDINLPGKDGFSVVREIRAISQTPILMLSARDSENDKLSGLESGADDYVEKPFSPREVVARIKTILRRVSPENENALSISYGDIRLDVAGVRVFRKEEEYLCTKTEFLLLKTLVEAQGKVVTREKLMQDIIGYSNYITDRTIDTHMKNIRKKLGDDVIETVRGIGYKCF